MNVMNAYAVQRGYCTEGHLTPNYGKILQNSVFMLHRLNRCHVIQNATYLM